MREYVEMAEKAAVEAAQVLNEMCGRLEEGDVEHKGRIDLVTAADKASERHVLAVLKGSFPRHGFWAEESGHTSGDEDYCWVIDPLDGTTNYAHGFPWYSVSIALLKGSQPVVGVVYHCTRQEMFTAELGGGAYCNGKRIHVSRAAKLIDGLFCTGFSYDIATTDRDNLRQVGLVLKRSRGVRRTGSAALDLCYVARGFFDGFWEFDLHAWDVAAGSLIVMEAGGKVTDFKGRPLVIDHGETVASNGFVHEELLEALA